MSMGKELQWPKELQMSMGKEMQWPKGRDYRTSRERTRGGGEGATRPMEKEPMKKSFSLPPSLPPSLPIPYPLGQTLWQDFPSINNMLIQC